MGVARWAALISTLLLVVACAPPPSAPSPSLTATAASTGAQPAAAAPATATVAAPASAPAAGAGRLFLEVREPDAEMVGVPASAQRIAVAGKSLPGAVVSVNGQLVDLDGAGAFRVEVALEDEITIVEVVASDAGGEQARVQRVIVKD